MPSRVSKDGTAARAFVENVALLVNYWGSKAATPMDAAEGVAFSLLTLIDGGNTASPGFLLMPVMCTDSEAERHPRFKEGVIINQTQRNDIMLHEMLGGALAAANKHNAKDG